MATEWMHNSCTSEQHQVAAVSSLQGDSTILSGAAMPGTIVPGATAQQLMKASTNISSDSDSGYNDAARGDSPPESAVIFSTPVTTRLRRPPLRTPSVVVSDCSDTPGAEPVELVLCNGDVDADKYDNFSYMEYQHHQSSSASPSTFSSNSQSSSSQEMDPGDQQAWTNCWPPSLRKSPSSGGFLILPGQEDESSMMLSSNLLAVRRLSDCSSSSSLATLDMEPCCSGACAAHSSNGDLGAQRSPSDSPNSIDEDEDVTSTSKSTRDDNSPSSPSQSEECCIPTCPSSSVKVSAWRKVRSAVQWSPFVQTFRRQRYPWVQLAGHQGNFKAGGERGTILKKLCPKEESCFQLLMNDPLRPFIPSYKGNVSADDGEKFLVLEDLLGTFRNPAVMDCKLGVRTYLEDELAKAKLKPKLRKDMFEKMLQVDPSAPTPEEIQLGGVTKPRYMVWRETISSTASLGFRIEGIRKPDGSSSKDYKTVGTPQQIISVLRDFVKDEPHALPRYIQRLQELSDTLAESNFFATHELIGSSLLFIHDQTKANVWMIDFAKTHPLPAGIQIDHQSPWRVGNHEDGYLTGLGNLTQLFSQLLASDHSSSVDST